MNSIFTINRQTENATGAGFPFYTKKEYQYRFWEYADNTPAGYIQVPNNKLPTFQLWFSKLIDTIELIPVDGQNDGIAITLPFSILRANTIAVSGELLYSFVDIDELSFNLNCGAYYLKVYDSGDLTHVFYSEVFHVGTPFSLLFNATIPIPAFPTITGQIQSDLPILSASYVLSAPAGTGISTPIPDPFDYSIVFALGVGLTSTLTITANTLLGNYTDVYLVSRPISDYKLTKQYV